MSRFDSFVRRSAALLGPLAVALATALCMATARAQGDTAAAKPVATDAQPSPTPAEPLSPDELFQMLGAADAAFRGFDYPRAAELYERITRWNPYNGDYWLRLARCQDRCGQLDHAVASFERGLELGDDSPPGQTQYQIAVLQVRRGETRSAIDWLEKAMAARHEHRHVLRTDKRLDPLRSDPRFIALTGEPVDADTLSREQRWNRDLDHLAAEAARMHVLWHEGDRAARFGHALDAIRKRIAASTDEQLLVEIQQAVVQLGDGHSLVRAAGSVPVPPRLPLRLYFFTDGLFVIDAAAPYRDLIGCRIDRIGSATVAEAERLLSQMVSHDNPMGIKSNGPASLVNPQRLLALGLIDNPSTVKLTVTDQTGNQRPVDVVPGAPLAAADGLVASQQAEAADSPLYLRRADENLWFQSLPEIDGVYVQFNDVGDQKGRQIVDVSRDLREYLAAHPTRTLVLDVRHNGGGNTYLTLPLLKALLYYELTQPDGQIFAVIGRATFSAAQNFTNDVDRLTGAIFVGEPTGSRPSFAGEGTLAVLPYSGIGLSISTRLHQHAYATDRRIWIAPDVPAELSSADYFANRDPALEAIRAIVKKPAAAEAVPK
jgi:tetratricopeptide (TPR) repeat protein